MRLLISLLLLIASFMSFNVHAMSTDNNDEVIVITHPSNPETFLPKNTLGAIFSMHLQFWPNRTSITVFVLADQNQLHKKFSNTILMIFPYQLRRTWDKQVFSGTGEAPILVKDIEQMKYKVANTPGSIGYIPLSALDDTVKKLEVK
jgi:ABC-type phosphate transport system substrate-binding protein